MAKQLAPHKFIFKIHSTRLRSAKWNLSLTIADARRNEEIVALNDSQMLRWIDELNGSGDCIQKVADVKRQIAEIKKLPSGARNRRDIQKLYARLDELLFRPDYMCLIVDKISDYRRACRGFMINGIKYVRLLGTNGGVKTSTIVFVSERLAPELRKRIENGRLPTPQIPAKFEAYRALTCSGSTPVSMPNGILVVPDCETRFREDIIMLNDENSDEPVMEIQKDVEVVLDESDGYGLILPGLAERWSQELKLDYVTSGVNCRMSWTKGMLFTFDFLDFADKIAGGKYLVTDAWGHEVDVRNVEMILTTSMLKLWQSYESIDHFLACCTENHYTFAVAKTCPQQLDDRRASNYQFLQGFSLTDDQIDELVQPTMDQIRGVLSDDYRKALVFLRGSKLTDDTVETQEFSVANALMVEPKMYDDPFVRRSIYRLIEKRIDDAKIGVLDFHANYSIVCGDPFALCQSVFGLEVTGLLRAGEIYNKYWVDDGAEYVACFRAPMSCQNSVLKRRVANSADMSYWYRYMKTCTLFNAWDSSAAALNGMDKDGDLVYLTSNKILVDNIHPMLTIFCAQRRAQKMDVTEELLIEANINSFGDDIGKTTNYITSMYDVQAAFEPGSDEYETLAYRIRSGQLFQQNCIDKAKGIICKPMPKHWHDYFASVAVGDGTEESEHRREFSLRILADKKPYFMCYIYPKLMKDYKNYMKSVSAKCMTLFGVRLHTLLSADEGALNDEQRTFVGYVRSRCPVSMGNCVVNRICRRFEDAFDGTRWIGNDAGTFEPGILKSGANYTHYHYYEVKRVYEKHRERFRAFSAAERARRSPKNEVAMVRENFIREFTESALTVCSNEEHLCDIAVDLCYKGDASKQFVWDVCSTQLMKNLLKRNGGVLYYPIPDPDGDFEYAGQTYSMMRKESDVWLKSL